jgi:hypothetical protein
MRVLRLLALTTSQEEGGAESHLRTTLGAVRAAGYELHVALPPSAGTSQLREALRTAGCEVYTLALGRQTRSKWGAYVAILGDALATIRLIVRVRPDVILLNLPHSRGNPRRVAGVRALPSAHDGDLSPRSL